ncbi:MAG: helix-turn-helix transcriptional regulator [Bacteroidetes bacterium]|nr:helix-turn-helix transcriptional regulator [Bacteroidota bacterium]
MRKIKNLRELRNFTQDYMSQQLNMTQAGYSKIESGNTDIAYSKRVARVLEVTPEDLITFDSQKYFNSFNNVKGNNNGRVIINMNADEIKALYTDKFDLLNRLLKQTEDELNRINLGIFGVVGLNTK